MKKNNSTSAVAPTFTLAKLFKAQELLIDSLVITDKILRTDDNKLVVEFKKELIADIYSTEMPKLSKKLKKVFSGDQIKQLFVLTKDNYDAYMANIEIEPDLEFPQELEIEDDDNNIPPIFLENNEPLIAKKDETFDDNKVDFVGIEPNTRISELTVKDFTELMKMILYDAK